VVELYKNDISIGVTDVSENGDFTFDKITLDFGDNYFNAIASTEKSGRGDGSETINIIFDNLAPSLTVTNPSEDSLSVDYPDFDIVGTTDKGSSVLINGKIVKVDDNGGFKEKWQLNTGKNDLEIIARDVAGNETKKSISITYSL
jgi:bacillopeptidase F